ncbi:MAG: glycosyltransferase family 2 protein [Mycobacteriales bacterium]
MLSVVVPMFDEVAVLPKTMPRMRAALDQLGDYELICVDDGSSDGTFAALQAQRTAWPQLRIVRLRANAGHQAALTAGLEAASGDYVVTIDADLQDPPELIGQMLDLAISQGVDVVYAIRSDRQSDSVFKRVSAGAYYWLARRFAGPQVPAHAGDFRLMSRAAVEALHSLPERHRVYRLLIPWLGFPSATVTYTRSARAAGTTKYPMSKMVRLATDSITSFTAAPLRLATWFGAGGFAICLLLSVVAVLAALFGQTVPGWASLTVSLLFLGAIQLLCLGLLGEYVGRLYSEMQRRPLYFVAEDTGAVGTAAASAPIAGSAPQRPAPVTGARPPRAS